MPDTKKWHPIDAIPRDRIVEIKTVKRLVRLAKVSGGSEVIERDGRRSIHCWRRDIGHNCGDLHAVAWRLP